MDFGLGFMFDAGPYGFSVLIAGARLGVRFELHLITQWGPPKRDPLETPYFTFLSLGPSKGVPKQSSSRGPAPEPRSVENCNTHAFGAVRGPWPAPLWGSISGHPFFHSETPCREIGIARSALLGVPFRGHLITQPVPQTRTCFEARFSTHAVTGPFQRFQGWLQLGVPGGMGGDWVVGPGGKKC